MSERTAGRRRVLLKRLYAEYDEEPGFAHLRVGGNPLVPGKGSMSPRLMFVGEAPGAREAKLREPFVGASGKVLNDLLESVVILREEVFITNVVKYRPPDNRNPTTGEVVAGRSYLWREHALLGFPPIVTLGRFAAEALGAEPRLLGEWQYVEGSFAPVLALRHPAYGIYQKSNLPLMFEQFKAVATPPTFPEE